MTRNKEGGQSATRLVDFLAHIRGTDFRHTADQLDMNPPLSSAMGALSAPTVQGTLELIGNYLANAGQGFVSIGEGYDVAAADFNVGTAGVPNLASAFAQAFLHPRLTNGGIILVKAGTYQLTSTVSVPAGIMIMGELGGTIINGLTIEQPMFIIKRAADRAHLTSTGLLSVDPIDKTMFFNIVLTDGYVDSSFTPKMTTVPMIRCETGSYFTAEQVTFLGKMGTLGAGPGYGRSKTLYAIGYTTVGSEESTCILERCVFDGMQSIINYTPATISDKLTINNCKARIFGTENSADNGDPSKNCFVLISGTMNVKITNNYFNPGIRDGINGQSYVTSMATFVSGSPSFVITGNTGAVAFSMGTGQESLVNDNATGSVFNVSSAGNNWNNQNFSNQWFMTVGDGLYSVGDVTGTTALNTALSYISASGSLAEVYVNFGAYTYSASTDLTSSVALIGRRNIDGSKPQITLNIGSASVDYLGNRYISLGSRIEHIEFRSIVRNQSVYVMKNILAGQVIVKDCIFTDTSLVIEKMVSDPAFVVVEECYFNSTGVFANNLQCLAPPTYSTEFRNCLFNGTNYALAIAGIPGIGYPSTGNPSFVTLENVMFKPDVTILTGNSPIGLNRYILLEDANSTINIKNVNITNNDTQIDSGILSGFDKWIQIFGLMINIEDSFISGPLQKFESDTYMIPTIFCEPQFKINCNNTVFSGGLPFQISGTSAFDYASSSAGAFINNCQFFGTTGNQVVQTVFDIDVTLGSIGGIDSTANGPAIDVSNCVFANHNTTAIVNYPVKHYNYTTYDVAGCVQLYAHGFDIHFNNNNLTGSNQINGVQTNVAGIIINAFTATSGTDGSEYSKLHISNNTVYIENRFIAGNSSDISATLIVNCSYLNISNNNLTMFNGTPALNNAAVLFIQNLQTSNGTAFGSLSSGIVTGNSFNRLSNDGTAPLTGGYVMIHIDSGRGTLVDNEFDALTYDGTSTDLVSNDGISWNISRNKNQTAQIALNFANANFSMSPLSNIQYLAVDYSILAISQCDIQVLTAGNPSLKSIGLAYGNTGTDVYYNIFWALNTILPKDTKIASFTCGYTSTGTFSTTGALSVTVSSANGGAPDNGSFSGSADLTSSTLGNISASPINAEAFNVTTDNLIAYMTLHANGAAVLGVTLSTILISYYW